MTKLSKEYSRNSTNILPKRNEAAIALALVPVVPLVLAMKATFEIAGEGNFNRGVVNNVADGVLWKGKCVAIAGDHIKDMVNTLMSLDYHQKQKKWGEQHMVTNQLDIACASITKDEAAKSVKRMMEKDMHASTLKTPSFVGIEKAWGVPIFSRSSCMRRRTV